LAILMLAALAVLVFTWMMAGGPYDPKQEMAAREAAAKGQTPMPGSEAALRRGINDILAGRHSQQAQQNLQKPGPLQSVIYLGGGSRGLLPGTGERYDVFRMNFRNGTLEGMVLQGKDGLSFAGWRNSGPPTPRQIIEGYASFPASVRATRTLIQLGVLLAAALIGRLLLRIRL
jgi:hypothetical protein